MQCEGNVELRPAHGGDQFGTASTRRGSAVQPAESPDSKEVAIPDGSGRSELRFVGAPAKATGNRGRLYNSGDGAPRSGRRGSASGTGTPRDRQCGGI